MPIVSKAQNAAMHAAAEGHSTLGIPQSVGKDFVAAGPASAKLPERVSRKFHREARRAAIQAGKTHPRSHAEFHAMGNEF